MAAPSPADALLARLREIALRFPASEEKLSHGAPSFHVKGKLFAMFADQHHRDGKVAAWCKAEVEEQQRLVRDAPDRYFVPPYVGVRGWVGVHLDRADTDWIELSMILERGWTGVAPPRLARDPAAWAAAATRTPKPPPERKTTDATRATEALSRVTKFALALPGATVDPEGQHASFYVKKKPFAYFLDNHHSDGVICVCVRAPQAECEALVAREPARFHRPAYIGARGWVGVRLDMRRVDWADVATRLTGSHAVATSKPAKPPKPKAAAPKRARAKP